MKPAQAEAPVVETMPYPVGPDSEADGDIPTKLRQLTQLRESGVITEANFVAKKDELLSQM
jgi:hypothetical protein